MEKKLRDKGALYSPSRVVSTSPSPTEPPNGIKLPMNLTKFPYLLFHFKMEWDVKGRLTFELPSKHRVECVGLEFILIVIFLLSEGDNKVRVRLK